MSTGYAEAYPEYVPDTRHRGRVSIAHVLPPSRDISKRRSPYFPVDLVFTSILGKSVLALGLHLTKEWLLRASSSSVASARDSGVSVGEAHWRLLAIAAIFLAIWHRPWDLFSNNRRIQVCVSLYCKLYCPTCTLKLIECMFSIIVCESIILQRPSMRRIIRIHDCSR